MRGIMDAVKQREAVAGKQKFLVTRIIMFTNGAAVTFPVRVLDDEKTAERVTKECDREMQIKLATGHVVVNEQMTPMEIPQGGSAQMRMVGPLQGVLSGEFGISRVFHGFHVVQDGEPSRIVAPPPGALS